MLCSWLAVVYTPPLDVVIFPLDVVIFFAFQDLYDCAQQEHPSCDAIIFGHKMP